MYFCFSAESRYILVLAESLSVLDFVIDTLEAANKEKPKTIFGSGFKDDLAYTTVSKLFKDFGVTNNFYNASLKFYK